MRSFDFQRDGMTLKRKALDLSCAGCEARFRMVPRGRRLPTSLTCPKCGESIRVPLRLMDSPPPTPASARYVDEGGPDLMALLGERRNFEPPSTADDAPLDEPQGHLPGHEALDLEEDACAEVALIHLIPIPAEAPRRAFPTALPPTDPPRARLHPLWHLALALTFTLVGLLGATTPYGAFGHRAIALALFGGGIGELSVQAEWIVERDLSSIVTDEVIREARARVLDARGPDGDTAEGLARLANSLHDEDAERARALIGLGLLQGMDPEPLEAARVGLLLKEGAFGAARDASWAALAAHPSPGLRRVLVQAHLADPDFAPPLPLTLREGRDFDRLDADGDQGARLLASFERAPGVNAIFWPVLAEAPSNPAPALAVERLCLLLGCRLALASSREARIEVTDLNTVAPQGAPSWRDEVALNVQGTGVWLYGAWQAPLREGSAFPIEFSALWQPWLSVEMPPALLNAPAANALGALGDAPREVARLKGDLSVALEHRRLMWVATQISELLILDYLTNHWQRFDPETSEWGSRTLLTPRGLALGDQPAPFGEGHDYEMDARLALAGRFSRTAILRLRLLDREDARRLLTPSASKQAGQEVLIDRLWERRRRLLAHVDRLIEAHGEEAVLILDGAEPRRAQPPADPGAAERP